MAKDFKNKNKKNLAYINKLFIICLLHFFIIFIFIVTKDKLIYKNVGAI